MSKELENVKAGILRDTKKAADYANGTSCNLAKEFVKKYLPNNAAAFKIAEVHAKNEKGGRS